ncbi:MAG TPA: hypothetical protein VGO93_14560 [Candidatus Xenobia bacterium]|jgi:hypothetical protein
MEGRTRTFDATLAGGAAIVVLYVAVRAACMPIAFDEAYSFFRYMPHPLLLDTENNHFLNSCLMALWSHLFGNSVFWLRLHSVLSAGLYAIFSLRTIRCLQHPAVKALAFAMLFLNPYLLDWFSLARGYGLGLGLEAVSLYYVVQTIQGPRITASGLLALLSGGFATLANLASIYPTVVTLAVLSGWRLQDRRSGRTERLRDVAWWSVSTVVCLVPSVLIVLHIRSVFRLAFRYGGHVGFWPDTVGSLIDDSLYGAAYTPWLHDAIGLGLGLVVAGALLAWATGLAREGPTLWLCLLLLGDACAIVAVHDLMGARYMIDRGAVWLIPVFAWTFAFLCDRAARLTPWVSHLALGLSALCLLHGLASVNLTGTPEEHADLADAERALQDLPAGDTRPATLSTVFGLTEQLRFYAVQQGMAWLSISDDVVPGKDFYLVPRADADRLGGNLRAIAHYRHDFVLLERSERQ